MTELIGVSQEDAAAIQEITLHRDTDAFCSADWSAVADDFDPDVFVGYQGGKSGDEPWRLAFPTLEVYRDQWVSDAKRFLAEVPLEQLRPQLEAAGRIASIEVRGRWALVRKEFDGEAGVPGRTERLLWRTYYFLRRDPDRWRITGFVGYLPYSGHAT